MKNGETIRVIDTRKNCFLAYQLYWELLIHWRVYLYDTTWFDHLSRLMRKQGVRVLNHLFTKPGRSRFEVSSQPDTASGRLAELLRSVLYDLIVSRTPQPHVKNYHVNSVGNQSREQIQRYVATQLSQADGCGEKFKKSYRQFQIFHGETDLSGFRNVQHVTYSYNLYMVLERAMNGSELEVGFMHKVYDCVFEVSENEGFRLSHAAVLPDRFEVVVGCPLETCPIDVVLKYMNDLASRHRMQPALRFGAYVNTFGEDEIDSARAS